MTITPAHAPSKVLPPLVGLIGAAGAGKSTVAHHLEHRHGWMHLAFADPIVEMVGALLQAAGAGSGWMTERALKESPAPVLGVSYRRMAQTLGTEWGRKMLHPDLWLRIALHKAHELRTVHGEAVVLADVRFENEAEAILQAGGELWRVVRETAALPGGASAHESEQYHNSAHAERRCRCRIFNLTSIATLEDQVDRIVIRLHEQTARAAAAGAAAEAAAAANKARYAAPTAG